MRTTAFRRLLAVLLTTTLVATVGGEAYAAPKQKPPKPTVQQIKPVPGQNAAPTGQQLPPAKPYVEQPKPEWPAAGSAVVDLTPTARSAGGLIQAGSLPVYIGAEAVGARAASTPPKVKVEVLEHGKAFDRAVLLRVTREDDAEGELPVRLSVDTAKFRTAGNADWARRLQIIALPDCAVNTPAEQRCAGTTLPSTIGADRVSAPITLPPGKQRQQQAQSSTFAVAAGPSGDAGSYAATGLSASSSWSSGGSSGDFSWSYPLRLPPALGGPAPTIGLDYSSSSVDGRTSAANNQPSWIGEGFEFWPGYVERSYAGCSEDKDKPGANNTTKTGDLCWSVDNATLSLAGSTVELVRDDKTGGFRPRKEDGSKIEHITSGAFGDHWKVTTTNGTQYWFGRGTLPGRGDSTSSKWGVPVSGNHSGEPCYNPVFAKSFCDQIWRWNLDYVVDPHGNSMSYWYTQEKNKYAKTGDSGNLAEYVRGGYLDHIEYGTRTADESPAAPMRVQFDTADRCATESNCDPNNKDNWKNWPDTPWDQRCTASPCYTGSPTFWSAKRLSKVTTKVRQGDGYTDVESWSFKHTWPAADNSTQGMWLDTISHSGKAGSNTSVRDVRLVPLSQENRVDPKGPDHAPALRWMRMGEIRTETGGVIGISYLPQECVAGTKVPTEPSENELRCYPVKWTPPGYTDAKTDYFHKYPVASVQEADVATNSPQMTTYYQYPEPPKWHYTDEDGLIGKDQRNWSKWRGYGKVITRKGDGPITENVYFRGMDGDKAKTGTRSADVQGVKDVEALAGQVRESITKDAVTGQEISAQVNDPWVAKDPTASRSINGVVVEARYSAAGTVRSRFALDGGRGAKTTKTTTDYNEFGLATKVWDFGDEADTTDDQCTITDYVPKNDAHLLDYPSRVRTYALPCDKDPASEADIIGDGQTSYDGQAVGVAPTKGDITKVEALKSWANGKPGYYTVSRSAYDDYGRVKESWDVKDKRSTTEYTPASGGPVTKTVSRNPLGHETTVELDPAWGLATATTDPNGKLTSQRYDGLGRLTDVWLPGNHQANNDVPNLRHEYELRTDGASAVISSTLNPVGELISSYTLYDGFLRQRQTQTTAPGDNLRLVTDTLYDNVGRVYKVNNKYGALGTPGKDLFLPYTDPSKPDANIKNQVVTEFDGASRPSAMVQRSEARELWRSTTTYGGDRTYVTPPPGGTPTTAISDSRGRTVELRQHTESSTPEGAFQATKYGYNRKNQLESVTDPAGNTWKYSYDLTGKQSKVEDPDKGPITMAYNDVNELKSTTDARGATIAYEYDDLGRPKASYDGQVGGTKRTETVYDELRKGLANRSIRYEGGQAYVSETTQFDEAYRPTQTKITIPAAAGSALKGTYVYDSTYWQDGSPNISALPKAGDLPAETTSAEYNKLGQPIALKGKSYYVTESQYTTLGDPGIYNLSTGKNDASVVLSYTYDEQTNRLSNLTTQNDSAVKLSDTGYGYDPAGNVTKIADRAAGDIQCFQYDRLQQLTEAWTPNADDCAKAPAQNALGGPAPYWQSFGYDNIGNRKTKVDRTPATAVTTRTSYPNPGGTRPHAASSIEVDDGKKKVTSNYGYNENGALTSRPNGANNQTLDWDAEGHVSKVKEGSAESTFLYDASGNRLIRKESTGWTLYLPGMEVKAGANGGGTAKTTRYYSHNGTVVAQRTSTGVTWLSSDRQGTAQVAVEAKDDQKATVRRQDPFGVPRGESPQWPNTHGFVGGDKDSTGLTHLGAREYDPAAGRFISVDPVFDSSNPQQMNAYSYAENSPITFSDPSGLQADKRSWIDDFINGLGKPTPPSIFEILDQRAGTNYWQASQAQSAPRPAPVKACGTWNISCKAKTVWKKTVNYVETHKAQIAGLAVGIVAGAVCGAAIGWTGVGAVACGAAAGALAGVVEQLVDSGGKVSWDTAKAGLTGAAFGAVGGAIGNVVGAGLKAGVAAILNKAGGKAAAQALGKATAQETRAAAGSVASSGERSAATSSAKSGACVLDNSFVPVTLVLMADGSHKAISEIKPGDKVQATDPETGKSEAREVVAAIVGEGERSMVDISVDTQGAETGTIVATQGHPIWVENRKAWVKAGELTSGDQVRTPSGELLSVLSVKAYTAVLKVHNLTIDQTHTFSVQAAGKDIITHNCGNGAARMAAAVARHGGEAVEQGFMFPSRRAARQAASEMVGNLGSAARAIRASDFRGGPRGWATSNRVIGREQLDEAGMSVAGWRDDVLGHQFGDHTIGPHVNIWGDGLNHKVHLFY
ncbi:RHS repeat protein [Pseudonocardiaceae bacterium YIM PH 21723]|nr:RHS repeat protein [Pseudonocardiaceae bacterium YIM PH 21723]